MTAPASMPAWAHAMRVAILAWFAAVFAAAIWAAWSVLNSAAANPECAIRHCKRYERVGDWFTVLTGADLGIAVMAFTGVVVLGWALFALPWVAYAWWLKQRGEAK